MNEVQENHLLIGLGGTGGQILRSFRKAIFQDFRKHDPDGVKLRYLYIDSNDEMMALDDPTWRILGTNVQLPQQSQLRTAGLNLAKVLDDVNDYPGIAPWIGSRDLFRNIIRSADGAKVFGGQKRRLGRFLFACRVGEYRERLLSMVRELQVGNTTRVTFHFLLGLAGGTGSGSVVDAVCQARALFPSGDYRIIIYALLPDKNPKPNRAGPNYHANGYAALVELNALDVGAYLPFDISATQHGRLDLQDPFNLCYLFTDENADNNRVDIDKELPDIVASFLFQKIINTKDLIWENAADSIKRQERFELGAQADKKELTPSTRKPERTRRFFAFGTKQIAYPEEEIREYLTYTLARQAALQLQYNNFSESMGFLAEPKTQAHFEMVRKPENEQKWLISDENLTLSLGILPDERANKKWKPISQYWMDLLPNFKALVLDSYGDKKDRWLDELSKLFEMSFSQNYREHGVRRFYDIKRGEQRDYCREIRKTIEVGLFAEWLNGTQATFDISRLVQALLISVTEKRQHFDEEIARVIALEKQTEARVKANGAEAAKIDWLKELLGARTRLFEAHGEALRELYTHRTRLHGLHFARALIDAVVTEVNDLGNEVARATTTITTATASFEKAIGERIGDAGQSHLQAQVVRFYKPEAVKDFARVLVRNEEQQKLQAAAVRSAIGSALGESQSFAAFNQRINEQAFRDILESTSELDVVNAHDAIMSADITRDRILRVNVLERLEKEYGGNRDALHAYITQIVSKAKNQIVFNRAEVQRVIPGNESIGPMYHYSTMIVPEGKDQPEFRKAVVDELKGAMAGPGEIPTNPKRPNEITILNVTSAFPARFAQDVSFLRDCYDARVGGAEGEEARFELHTEGDGTQWPSLFLRKITRADVLPRLLIANTLGIVQTVKDPVTGISSVYLMTRDDSGRENPPTRLGKDLAEAADCVDALAFDLLESTIGQELATTYLHRDRRTELYAAVRKVVDGITATRSNPLDPVRLAYISADRNVENLLELKK